MILPLKTVYFAKKLHLLELCGLERLLIYITVVELLELTITTSSDIVVFFGQSCGGLDNITGQCVQPAYTQTIFTTRIDKYKVKCCFTPV